MANSRFAYVRSYELPDTLLPGTYIVCRIDGRGFHKFTDTHGFQKPNDERGLQLMDKAAESIMRELPDVVLAFGESDEYSFLLRKSSTLYSRRSSKTLSTILSIFTSSYVFHWPFYFPTTKLQYPPSFDARLVLYPGEREVRDYFSWRQADTHINNLHNTTFWALVQQGGLSTTAAHAELRGTVSAQKHEILHGRFGVNYNDLPPRFRKGSVLARKKPSEPADSSATAPATASSSTPRPPLVPSASAPPEALYAESSSSASPTRPCAMIDPSRSSDPPTEPFPFPLPVVFSHCEPPVPATSQSESPNPPLEGKMEKKPRTRQPPPWDGTSGAVEVLHVDVIGDGFWEERPWLLR